MKLKLLINPLCKGAYFADVLAVTQAELQCIYPNINIGISKIGSLNFIDIDAFEKEQISMRQLSRLSFVQGILEQREHNVVSIVDVQPKFKLPEEIVWGNKYRGKTNEIVTQLAINIGLHHAPIDRKTSTNKNIKLLDPMAGRGTTLLWANRYGLDAVGIEKNRDALDHFCRHVKGQCKLHRIKHKYIQGNIGKKNKASTGAFHEIQWEHCRSKIIIGDSSKMTLLSDRFDLIVCDIPYGIQFFGKGNQRNPLQLIKECAPNWIDRLYPEGIVVIVFNSFQPKRTDLIDVFEKLNLEYIDFQAPHRMSESIKRDIVIFKKISP